MGLPKIMGSWTYFLKAVLWMLATSISHHLEAMAETHMVCWYGQHVSSRHGFSPETPKKEVSGTAAAAEALAARLSVVGATGLGAAGRGLLQRRPRGPLAKDWMGLVQLKSHPLVCGKPKAKRRFFLNTSCLNVGCSNPRADPPKWKAPRNANGPPERSKFL